MNSETLESSSAFQKIEDIRHAGKSPSRHRAAPAASAFEPKQRD